MLSAELNIVPLTTIKYPEIATAPLFRFTRYTANDFTTSMIFQFDLQPHFIEILDSARYVI